MPKCPAVPRWATAFHIGTVSWESWDETSFPPQRPRVRPRHAGAVHSDRCRQVASPRGQLLLHVKEVVTAGARVRPGYVHAHRAPTCLGPSAIRSRGAGVPMAESWLQEAEVAPLRSVQIHEGRDCTGFFCPGWLLRPPASGSVCLSQDEGAGSPSSGGLSAAGSPGSCRATAAGEEGGQQRGPCGQPPRSPEDSLWPCPGRRCVSGGPYLK